MAVDVTYLFPLLMDLVLFVVFLRVADAAGRDMHLGNAQAASIIAVYSVVYSLVCLLAGWILSRRNARAFLVASTLLVMAVSVPLLFVNTYVRMLASMAALGVAMAFFFNSFQTMMRGDVPPGSLPITIARYNIAWCSGLACGFLFGGFLHDLGGSLAMTALCTAACLVILVMAAMHRPRPLSHESSDATVEASPPSGSPVDPRYVLIGWWIALLCNFTQRPLTTFTPKFYAEAGYGAWRVGTLLFCLFILQAISNLFWHRMRYALYRRTSLLLPQVLMAIGLTLLWRFPAFGPSVLTMTALGAVYGFLFWSSIYYVSNDRGSSFNVGVNEAMVGVGNVLGALGCSWVMAVSSHSLAFFPVCIGLIVLMLPAQFLWLAPRKAELP